MGVDACMFAKKAKRYYYFDRLYNINRGIWAEDALTDDEFMEGDRIYYKLINDKSATAAEVRKLCELNLKGYKTTPDDDRSGWIMNILEFVNKFPDDEFFVQTDHEQPPSWGYQKGEYHNKYYSDLTEHVEWNP